jgi:hypothetical protein
VFQGCDDVATRELAQLATAGVVASCTAGCAHCCSLEIPMSRVEGEALVEWLLANRSVEELAAIRDRLRAWLVWYRTEYPRLVASGLDRSDVFFRHAPLCALNVDGRCSAYPVRPVTCRNHYVTSPVATCDPARGSGEPDMILSISRASRTHVAELRGIVERQGGDYIATIHLLAEWLAHLLEVEREPWIGAPKLQLGS